MSFLVDRCFRKYVPTDMHWGGTYRGGYAEVSVVANGREEGGNHMVSIHGTDDCACVRFFSSWASALAVYNRTTFLASHADLRDFEDHLPGANNNGWPHERTDDDDEDYDGPDVTAPSWSGT